MYNTLLSGAKHRTSTPCIYAHRSKISTIHQISKNGENREESDIADQFHCDKDTNDNQPKSEEEVYAEPGGDESLGKHKAVNRKYPPKQEKTQGNTT
eukprot:9263724-Ditylum_brightwellii.AAC.1